MLLRYYFETIVGIICLVLILILGSKGIVSLALFALLPIIMRSRKTKIDERELHLFYKAGNITMGGNILFLYLIFRFSSSIINGNIVGDNWFYLAVTATLFVHGAVGLFLYKTQ